jgi:hypothetical protein
MKRKLVIASSAMLLALSALASNGATTANNTKDKQPCCSACTTKCGCDKSCCTNGSCAGKCDKSKCTNSACPSKGGHSTK